MPQASNQGVTQYYEPVAIGPVAQTLPVPPTPVPATIAAGATWDSGLINADGYKAIAVGVTLDQAGSLKLLRFIDGGGVVAQGAASTQALAAGAPGVLNVNDNLPFQSFRVQIQNSSAAVAHPGNFALLLNAQ